MGEDGLRERLRKHLSPDCFRILKEGLAYYFDFLGVSFGEDADEQKIIDAYIAATIADMVGCAIKVIEERHAGNGHFNVRYERIEPSAERK
jgi:hypothetical protein